MRLKDALPEIVVGVVFIAAVLVVLFDAASQYGWFR